MFKNVCSLKVCKHISSVLVIFFKCDILLELLNQILNGGTKYFCHIKTSTPHH